MRKLYLLLTICFILTGCGNASENSSGVSHNVKDKVDMASEEIELLKGAYINEDRIEDGYLYDYQYRNLQYIRDAKEYMSEKYDKDDFNFTSFIPLTSDRADCELHFYEDDEMYTVYVNEDGDIVDDYYKVYITEPYNEAVEDLIQENLGVSVIVSTSFPHPYGKNINGNLTPEEIFELGDELGRDTRIYSDSSISEDNLKSLVLNNNLYGSYKVYLVPDIKRYDSALDLDENLGKNYSDKYSFSYWEIEDEEQDFSINNDTWDTSLWRY